MHQDIGPTATLARVEAICVAAREALTAGLRVATQLHARFGYSPRADAHFFHHAVRREAMENLKQLSPQLEDQDNLGFSMSGLVLTTDQDVIRVWHTAENMIPPPATDRARAFVSQGSAWSPGTLFASPEVPTRAESDEAIPALKRNHLILQWTESGTELSRFSLVRPVGIGGRPAHVETDWTRSLLPVVSQQKDITYRRRDEGQGMEEGQA